MGWQKGRPRKPKVSAPVETDAAKTPEKNSLSWRAKMRSESAEWRDESSDNQFALAPHVHAWLDDAGLVAQWNVETVCGQPIESLMAVGDMRKYWEPVQEGDIPEFSGVERGGLRLYVRPKTLQQKAEDHRAKAASDQVKNHEHAMLGGDLRGNTPFDTKHLSVRQSNKINHGYERVAVPAESK